MNHSFNVEHAAKYGLHEAILIHSFQFWISLNRSNGSHLFEDRTWSYNTYEALGREFPYWTIAQVRYAIKGLIEAGVLLKRKLSERPDDNTNWYAFSDEATFLIHSEAPAKIHRRSPTACENPQARLTRLADAPDTVSRSYKDQSLTTVSDSVSDVQTPVAIATSPVEPAAKKTQADRSRKNAPLTPVQKVQHELVWDGFWQRAPDIAKLASWAKGREAKAIAGMLRQDYTAAQILFAYDCENRSGFWRTRFLSMQTVSTNIAKLLGHLTPAEAQALRRLTDEMDNPDGRTDPAAPASPEALAASLAFPNLFPGEQRSQASSAAEYAAELAATRP